MEVYVGNVVISERMLACCLLFSFLRLWTFVISWSRHQEKVLAPWGSPATFQDSGRWTHSLASVCSPCIWGTAARGASLGMANIAAGRFWGNERQPRTDPEPKGQVGGIRGAREERWILLGPFGLFQIPQDPVITSKRTVVCWYLEELVIKFKSILIFPWLAA